MSDEEHLLDMLLAWEERFKQGQDAPAEDFCKECPELVAALTARIKKLKKVAWMNTPPGANPSKPSPLSEGESESASAKPVTLAGRYRLETLIAEGGSGQVWRGYDQELQRPVAIKVPKNRRLRAEDEETFLIEARRVANLRHPGIVPVYDVGRHEGVYFIVYGLIDGQDLGALLRQKPLSVREAVRIVAEAAGHLHYAHQQGFIHRDIKPPNLLMDNQGQVYITDFGIAATVEQLRLRGDDGCGTLAYMSPEQLHGDNARIDARTDIYSMGLVLYELLTKQHPFEADTPEALHERILRLEPRSPRSLNRQIPREVERICLKCLAKSPVDRYATAKELADALTHSLRNSRRRILRHKSPHSRSLNRQIPREVARLGFEDQPKSSVKRWHGRFAVLMLLVTLALIGLIPSGTTKQDIGERQQETKNEANNRTPNAKGGLDRRLALPKILIPAALENGEERDSFRLLIKIRDRLVGVSCAALSKEEQDIADLLIDAGLLSISEEESGAGEKPNTEKSIKSSVWDGKMRK